MVFAADRDDVGRELFAIPRSAVVSPCVPGANTLCLNGGRFAVDADWRDFAGNTGRGRAVQLTADSGYFWFFGPGNVEVVVKALDGCGFNDRFWFFAAGLTDVGVELTVTDTATGAVQSYSNPLLTPFQPIQDIDAFSGCELGAGEAAVGKEGDGEALLLRQGRFRVETAWTIPGGVTGDGTAVALTDESGTFWFFGPDNVEVVIKVLDGCAFNDRFWVFASGLTNVEVELTVTDLETGEVRAYSNPLGRPFVPILDTAALTCP